MASDLINIADPIILLSMINMKLRDQYFSFDYLCSDLELNKEDIISKMNKIGYKYNKDENQFK